MSNNRTGKPLVIILLALFLLAALACLTAASADDAQQLKLLPGSWGCTSETEKEGEAPREVETTLTLGENGEMSLRFDDAEGNVFSYEGTWSSEYVADELDRLTLRFTSTDNPAYAEGEYNAECVYEFYTESWEENDTRIIYMIPMEVSCIGVSPFEEVYGYTDLALKREQGPNMRVVNCENFVSLRAKPSKSSSRITKVPRGALVLAYLDYGEKNGFLACMYQGQFGYILAEYLEPAE